MPDLPAMRQMVQVGYSGDAELEPVRPSCRDVPPGAVDDAVGADGEQVQMVGEAGHDSDGGAGSAGQAAQLEPAGPAAGGVPPGAVGAVVGADREQVQMVGVAGDRGDRGAG